MTEQPGQPWGMCAAFGCPLPGTTGSENQWYCCCHVNKPSTLNNAITARLRGRLAAIVATTLDIRRYGASFHDSPDTYRTIQKRFVSMARHDLLFGFNGADRVSPHARPDVRLWLARLESVLIAAVADTGATKPVDLATPATQAAPTPTPTQTPVASFVAAARDSIARRRSLLVDREPGADDE
jgi:hypothetical protein